MESVVAGIVGVAGVLLGAALTHRLQRTSAREERAWRDGQTARSELLEVSAGYAAAVSRVKRAVVAVRLSGKDSGRAAEALAEADRLGAEAEAARFRLEMVVDDAQVLAAADEAFAAAGALRSTPDHGALVEGERAFESAVRRLAEEVRRLRSSG